MRCPKCKSTEITSFLLAPYEKQIDEANEEWEFIEDDSEYSVDIVIYVCDCCGCDWKDGEEYKNKNIEKWFGVE